MRIVAVYRQDSEHRRSFESFLKQLHNHTGRFAELVDPDTVSGADFCRLYDIVAYPTLICLSADGAVVGQWSMGNLPSMGELAVLIES